MKKIQYRVGLIAILSFISLAASAPDAPTGTGALSPEQPSGRQTKGRAIFSENCAVCHTPGVGDATVPDLKGVTLRRAESWLKSFIQFPSKMFEAKDPVAGELLAQYKEPMSDPGLTPEDVDAVVEYLETMDKEIKLLQESAAVAVSSPLVSGETSPDRDKAIKKITTKAEVKRGGDLFQGKQMFFHGGPSCISCHDIRNSTIAEGGRLAKELASSYPRLGEVRMRAILEKPPFPLMREAFREHPLTDDEISNLLAFFKYTDKEHRDEPQRHYGDAMLFVGISSVIGLLGFYSVFWSSRRRKSVNKNIYDRQTKSEEKL